MHILSGPLRSRFLLAASLTLLLLGAAVASATACPVPPATSKWEGPWKATGWINSMGQGFSGSNGEGTWRAELTSQENRAGSGNYLIEGPGEVEVRPTTGPEAGQTFHVKGELVEGVLECTSATTDTVSGKWIDERYGPSPAAQAEDHLGGELELNSVGAVEGGSWVGDGIYFGSGRGHPLEQEEGTWEGEFRPTAGSGGPVKGKVELTSPSGTLSTVAIELASHLPQLPSNDFAPVGGVHFTVQLAPGVTNAKIKLTLPIGSNPMKLLKLVGGTYTEVPATITGDEIEYELTDGGPFDEDGTANGEIVDPVVPVHQGFEVTTGTVPQATRDVAYTTELAAAGGTPPYKWKKVGKLPKGLKLSKTGTISGTPSSKLTPGSYRVGVMVTDSEKPKNSATASFTLKVN